MPFVGFLACAFWAMLVFMAIRNYRYHLRKRGSKEWPVLTATVQKSEGPFQGPFLSIFARKVPKSLFGYSYTVGGVRYIGFFAVARDSGLAAESELQQKLDGMSVSVRYDPEHPGRSFVVDSEVSGKDIHQSPDWIPRSLTDKS